MIICAGAKIIGSKIILGTTDYRMGTDKLQGCAWQAKLAMRFQIPSQASLHGIMKSIAHFATQMALLFAPRAEIFWRK